MIFCFCRQLIFDYICVNNCKKSTAPDNGRIEAHMDDQRTKIKGMELQAMEHHEIDPEIVNALEEYLHDIFQDSHHNDNHDQHVHYDHHDYHDHHDHHGGGGGGD